MREYYNEHMLSVVSIIINSFVRLISKHRGDLMISTFQWTPVVTPLASGRRLCDIDGFPSHSKRFHKNEKS